MLTWKAFNKPWFGLKKLRKCFWNHKCVCLQRCGVNDRFDAADREPACSREHTCRTEDRELTLCVLVFFSAQFFSLLQVFMGFSQVGFLGSIVILQPCQELYSMKETRWVYWWSDAAVISCPFLTTQDSQIVVMLFCCCCFLKSYSLISRCCRPQP